MKTMKIWKRPAIAFAAALACALLAKPSAADARIARTNAPVNLREGPGTHYAIFDSIPKGARVRILGCTAGYTWCAVSYDGTEGYSDGHYLAVVEGVNSGALVTAVGVGVALSIPLWRRDHWRPRHHHGPGWGLPGHRPPGMRPPGHRPPGMKSPGHRPPGMKPPGHRPMPKPHGGKLEPKR